MKITKKLFVLLLLIYGLIVVQSNTTTTAQSTNSDKEACLNSCGEAYNSCYTQAQNNYEYCLVMGNGNYSACADAAQASRDQCEDNADENYNYNSQGCYYTYMPEDIWGWGSCCEQADQVLRNDYQNCGYQYSYEVSNCRNLDGSTSCNTELNQAVNNCYESRNYCVSECHRIYP